MKRIYNLVILSVWAMLTVCCSSEEPILTPVKIGDEVKFALSLEDVTRTVYGGLEGEAGNNAYPIYWNEGDKVQIYSPNCLQGRNNAEYKVVLPENVSNPNYAKDLQKTGPYGIQWGEDAKAVFYSLYPSGNYTINTDKTMAEGINIALNQNIYVNEDQVSVTSFMEDCIMYAKSKEVDQGGVVNLQYRPVTTTFMLTLNVPSTSADDFMIQSISLTASTKIVGDFSINIADGTFGDWGANSSNSVTAQIFDKTTGGFYTLVKGNSITIPLFIAPVPNLNIEGWTVKIVTDKGQYTKTLEKDYTNNKEGKINPGEVHRITLPNLATTTETVWNVANWMVNIPRNVYLSEISIPGTWNSLNTDCQSDCSIKKQYEQGVRAFHIDTRWRADNSPLVGSTFLGITKPTITELSVAVGGSDKTYKYDGANLMRKSAADTFSGYLKQVTDAVKDDEYMVVFCTFSQNSYNGDRCPSTWYEAVSAACKTNDRVYNASSLSSNTLVGDVLGHVIVVVNLDASVSSSILPADSKCLFTYVTMLLPSDHYAETTSHIDGLHYGTKAESGISMYTSHAQISTTKTSSVNCGDRGYSHPLTSRDNLVTSFWDWSKSNYGTPNYNHDKWIYLGLGGYIMESSASSGDGYDDIENRYGPMVYNRINEMGKNNVPFYPVGIILMNNKKGSNYTDSNNTDLNYGFSDVCKQILLLNNKYRLQYDSDKPADYNPNAKARSDYDGSLTSGGNAI